MRSQTTGLVTELGGIRRGEREEAMRREELFSRRICLLGQKKVELQTCGQGGKRSMRVTKP